MRYPRSLHLLSRNYKQPRHGRAAVHLGKHSRLDHTRGCGVQQDIQAIQSVQACQHASEDARKLLKEIQTLAGTLHGLRLLADQVDGANLKSNVPPRQLYHCQQMLEKMLDKLKKADPDTADNKFEKVLRTVRWPFGSSETEELLAEMERHKATFNLTVSMDSMEALLVAISGQADIATTLEQVKDDICRIEMTQERKEVLEFFGSFDPEANHRMSLKLQQSGTGLWLIEGLEFQKWLSESNSKLWLFGIPGVGKTVLASLVIEESLKLASPALGVAYYYCDYKSSKSQQLQNILASLAGQLAQQDERCYATLQKSYRPGNDRTGRHILPDESELSSLVVRMASFFANAAVIVDGLDECGTADDVTMALSALAGNIKLLFLSRNERHIRCHLEHFAQVSIAARSSDLRLYVSAEIEQRTRTRKLRIRSPDLKEKILDRLVNGADGM